MTEDLVIAAMVADRQAFEHVRVHGQSDDFTVMGQHWYGAITEYYDRDPDASRADAKLLRRIGLHKVPEKHREQLGEFFDSLPIVGASPANVVSYLAGLQKQNVGFELAHLVTDPEAQTDKVLELIDRYQTLLTAADAATKLDLVDYDALQDLYDQSSILKVYPTDLGSRLVAGGMLPGHHALIFGRPEAGKSAMAITIAGGFARHGHKVLYFGNEDAAKIMASRIVCRMSNRSLRRFQHEYDSTLAKARANGLDNFDFTHLEPGTPAEIEAGIRDLEPDVIVVDQITGIDMNDTNQVRSTDRAARTIRSIGGRYGLVTLSVAQAGDRTERHGQLPPAYPTMGDVYGSRTGLPAQVDLMIGIGFDSDMYERNLRGISLPKNKLGGRHENFQLRFDQSTSTFRNM